jgi:hypothetical protein
LRLIKISIDSLFPFSFSMAQKISKGTSATTTGHVDNAGMFLKRGLEKLLSEKDIKKSQFQQLKRACESALGLFDFSVNIFLISIFYFSFRNKRYSN